MLNNTLVRLLLDASAGTELATRDWDRLLPLLRGHGMLGRLACQLADLQLLDSLAAPVLPHLQSARIIADANQRVLHWEINRIRRALLGTDIPVTLLKGAAYAHAGLPMARGRLSSDVDILVAREHLETVEQCLLDQGWLALKQDPYDQQYYRRWMHELPPLQHRLRGTVVDVHHTILPLTSRLQPDPEALLAARQMLEPGLYVLCPVDMLLHSVVHGFHDGEFASGLRDLLDVHDLLAYCVTNEGESFWAALLQRARLLGLERPLYYSLRYTQRFLGTRVPAAVMQQLGEAAPGLLSRAVMDWSLSRVLPSSSANSLSMWLARGCLYWRSHCLRMPPGLLVRHLLIKVLRRGGVSLASGRTK